MRILMLTDFYHPYTGGVEEHVRRLSHALCARGHAVAVVTQGSDELPAQAADGPVRVYRVRGAAQRLDWLFSHRHRPWAPPFPDPEAARRLRDILRSERPHIVHGHDWLARAFVPLKAASRARFVMSLHYYTLSCAKKSLMFQGAPCSGPSALKCLGCASSHYGALKGLGVTLANWTFSVAERAAVDIFLPVSRVTASGNGLGPGDRFEVVPNFMPEAAGPPGDLSHYTSQLPQTPFLLFVGDLRRAKGLEVLLEAYAGLSAAPPLVLIGKLWPETPQHLPPNVFVCRDWPNTAVLAAWERSLMGIVPSIWPEPFGIVVIEAMASGRPVIAAQVGGLPELVGAAGLLVPPGDAAALRRAIMRLLEDTELRAALGQAGRRRAASFAAAAIVPRIEHIYRRLCAASTEKHAPTAGEHHYQQL